MGKVRGPKVNGATFSVALSDLSYHFIENDVAQEDVQEFFTCQYKQLSLKGTEGLYQFEVRRFNLPAGGFDVRLTYGIQIEWMRTPEDARDFENPIAMVKEILAARASSTIATLTQESIMIPMITPPFFDEDE